MRQPTPPHPSLMAGILSVRSLATFAIIRRYRQSSPMASHEGKLSDSLCPITAPGSRDHCWVGHNRALRECVNPAYVQKQIRCRQATNHLASPRGDSMTGQRPGPDSWQGRPRQAKPEPHKGDNDNSSYVESMKAIQELLKTIRAFISAHKILVGGGMTIVIVVAIGAGHHTPTPPPPSTPYPVAAQQSWMSSCEVRNNNTPSICSCELTYFEQHTSYAQFEQYYGNMPPGVVPPELANAESCRG